jgi:hypothetical protein
MALLRGATKGLELSWVPNILSAGETERGEGELREQPQDFMHTPEPRAVLRDKRAGAPLIHPRAPSGSGAGSDRLQLTRLLC